MKKQQARDIANQKKRIANYHTLVQQWAYEYGKAIGNALWDYCRKMEPVYDRMFHRKRNENV